MWTNTLWNQWPKHMIESKRDIPSVPIEVLPDRPRMEKRVRPHRQTAIARKNYMLFDMNR